MHKDIKKVFQEIGATKVMMKLPKVFRQEIKRNSINMAIKATDEQRHVTHDLIKGLHHKEFEDYGVSYSKVLSCYYPILYFMLDIVNNEENYYLRVVKIAKTIIEKFEDHFGTDVNEFKDQFETEYNTNVLNYIIFYLNYKYTKFIIDMEIVDNLLIDNYMFIKIEFIDKVPFKYEGRSFWQIYNVKPKSQDAICKVKTEGTCLEKLTDKEELYVMIQDHAIKSLYERLSIETKNTEIMKFNLHVGIAFNINDRDFFTYSRALFIPYKLTHPETEIDLKVGYFVGIVVDDKILIKTFLFLTMDGTPEGDCLKRQTRLNRTDKDFLDMNRLSNYVNNDNVKTDSELYKILEECGCNHLFIHFHFKEDNILGIPSKTNKLFEKLHRYTNF